ncbi:MAG: UDP-2,3-diacylglucosamine diphosphatase [Gammaproteobacteria bacterium]|nr:UDP-2,3-diacylglucosamine diphosphatase [Gammaproteobacteria bacterium]MYK69415.1 UDP-2,3-diacylglucosamine diphosphatase [Gammaproteobacteria bacterium]
MSDRNPRPNPQAAGPAYVVSDAHLGAQPGARAADLVDWLRHVRGRASHVVLNGDIFDFWFEYRRAIPRGHVRVLGAVAEVVDAGVPVTFLGGNHDWWGGSCLAEEIGVSFHRAPIRTSLAGRSAYIAHGDGLGRGDYGYRVASGILRSRMFRRGFRWIHPDLGVRLAAFLSRTDSHEGRPGEGNRQRARALELLAMRELERDETLDIVVFGHTHVPAVVEVAGRYYLNAGTWMRDRCYAVIEASGPPRIEHWEGEPPAS